MAENMRLPETLAKGAELMCLLGFVNIAALDGCAEHQVDEDWWIAFNGHREATMCSKEVSVPPFSMFVFWRDVPAGAVDAGGGCMIGMGDGEDKLIEALDAAIEKASGRRGSGEKDCS